MIWYISNTPSHYDDATSWRSQVRVYNPTSNRAGWISFASKRSSCQRICTLVQVPDLGFTAITRLEFENIYCSAKWVINTNGPNVQNCETSSLQTFDTASWDTSKVCFQIENQEHLEMFWRCQNSNLPGCSAKTPFIKVMFSPGKKFRAAWLLQGPNRNNYRSMMIKIQP